MVNNFPFTIIPYRHICDILDFHSYGNSFKYSNVFVQRLYLSKPFGRFPTLDYKQENQTRNERQNSIPYDSYKITLSCNLIINEFDSLAI